MGSADANREQAILNAARALLVGAPGGLTMGRLAELAGVSRTALYRLVGTKAQLLARLAAEPPPASTRDRILQAARRVFGRHGLSASLEQVAREAGVGVATVYRLFGSREGLLRAFAEEFTPRAAVRERALRPTADVAGDLEAILRLLLEFFSANGDLVRLALLGTEAERAYLRRLRAEAESTLGYLAAYFAHQIGSGRIKPAADPTELALAVVSLAFGFAVLGPLYSGIRPESSEAASRIVRILLDGLLSPEGPEVPDDPSNAPPER